MKREDVTVELEEVSLPGYLRRPPAMRGVVIFAHGTGSSRDSSRNNYVADRLADAKIGSLLFDLLTEAEDSSYETRFEIDLLQRRMTGALRWAGKGDLARGTPYGLFGSSTGSAAALATAAEVARGEVADAPEVSAIVSRGGRPDMAEEAIPGVSAPTLLIVGGRDIQVLQLHHQIFEKFQAEAVLEIVEDASHLFQEPGALERVADLAVDWFSSRL